MTSELKVGQTMVIGTRSGWYSSPYYFAEVVKISATQVTLSNGKRYLIRNGEEVGGGNYGTYLVRDFNTYNWKSVDAAKTDNAEREKMLTKKSNQSKLKQFDWTKLTDEDLSVILEIIKKYG